MTAFSPPGWTLLGAFPDNATDDVGSWLLSHGGEAMLLEVPPGLTPAVVRAGLDRIGATLRFATASHAHEDHFDPDAWNALVEAFPDAVFIFPAAGDGARLLYLGGEPVYLIRAPKHSATDVVTVFRGVAMTGDIELGQVESVNREVKVKAKRASMAHLAGFPERAGYHVHAVMSAHLNDVRTGVDWPALFSV